MSPAVRRSVVRLLVAIAATAAGAASAKPLKGLCEGFEPFRKIADLPYVKPVVRVAPEDKAVKPQDVAFTIAAKAGTIRVTPDADGVIQLPLTDALCAENPDVVTSPEGKIGLSVSIDPQVPPVRTLDYKLLDSLRAQWAEAVARQNLVYRMLAPSAKAFHVVFEPGKPASAEVRLAQGTRTLAADAKGDLFIPFEAAWAAANPAIVLSDMPKKIGLSFKGH